jgi:hypothetical protein
VLFLWEPRSYYSDVASEPDAILERWPWLVYRHDADLEAIDEELHAKGYTHVLYYRAGADLVQRAQLDPLGEREWAALDRYLDQHLEVEEEIGDAYVLYALR